MRRIIISIIAGVSLFTLVSCVDNGVENKKYPIDDYIKRGATLDEYLPNGTAAMRDSDGRKFFVGNNSTYKARVNDNGILMPLIVVNEKLYYFDLQEKVNSIQDNLKKDKIRFFQGEIEVLTGDKTSAYSVTQGIDVFINVDNADSVYVQSKDSEVYQVWRTYDE